MIEREFKTLNQSLYQNFNATLLNETAGEVNAALIKGSFNVPNYLFATLVASNASTGTTTETTHNSRSSLAMSVFSLLRFDTSQLIRLDRAGSSCTQSQAAYLPSSAS